MYGDLYILCYVSYITFFHSMLRVDYQFRFKILISQKIIMFRISSVGQRYENKVIIFNVFFFSVFSRSSTFLYVFIPTIIFSTFEIQLIIWGFYMGSVWKKNIMEKDTRWHWKEMISTKKGLGFIYTFWQILGSKMHISLLLPSMSFFGWCVWLDFQFFIMSKLCVKRFRVNYA